MLDARLSSVWQTPLHQQWLHLPQQAVHDGLNYSSGGALGIIQVRGLVSDAAFMQAVEQVLGASLPTQAKQVVYAQDAAALWVSPDEWVLLLAHARKDRLLQDLQAALQNVFAQVVDNSGGFMLLHIHGTQASTVLRHLTTYPVLSMQNGECVQTMGKKTPFLLVKVADNDYGLIFRRSFADYLWRILQKTARPYGCAVHKSWQFQDEVWQRYTAA